MCLLKIYSDQDSFKKFERNTVIPVYSIQEKGDIRRKETGEKYTDYKISFDVSEKDWDDFTGQVNDAIEFLSQYHEEIKNLMNTHKITDAYLDFPLYSRLNSKVVNQNDHLPRELISLAGSLNIGIEMAIYSKEAMKIFDSIN